MPRYTIEYSNGNPNDTVYVEMERYRFTHRDWKTLMSVLVDCAGDSVYKHLAIRLYRDGELCFTVRAETRCPYDNSAALYTTVYSRCRVIREIILAE